MKIKNITMLFLSLILGVVLTYVSVNLTLNSNWVTYEFLNEHKEYGVIPLITGVLFGIFSGVNLIFTLIYTHDQDFGDDNNSKWFLLAYAIILSLGLFFATILYMFTVLNALVVILIVLLCIFGLSLMIHFFDEIKIFFKDKFNTGKDVKVEIKESEWDRQRKERCVRDYVKHCRGK